MGFLHYSLPNGDRDDDDDDDDEIEMEPRSLVVEAAQRHQKIYYPNCFDFDYYDSFVTKYKYENKSKSEAWSVIGRYAHAVLEFYCKLMQNFAATENPTIELPEYVTNEKLCYEIDTYFLAMKEHEKRFVEKLSCFEDEKILENRTVYELLRFADKAWMIYFCLTQVKPGNKTFLNYAVEFEKKAKQSNLDDDFEVANLFSMQSKVEFYIKNNIFKFNQPNSTLSKFSPEGQKLYQDLYPYQLFEEVIMSIKGYSPILHKSTILTKTEGLQNEAAKELIEFYKDYEKIKLIIRRLNRLENPSHIPEGLNLAQYEFRYLVKINGEDVDLYKMASDYLTTTLFLLAKTPSNYNIHKDLEFIYGLLSSTLEKNKQLHSECHKQLQHLNKKV